MEEDKTKEPITETENRALRVLVVECENSKKLQDISGLSYLDCILLKQKLRRQQEGNYNLI